jgi:hypothetical protein
MSPFFKGGFSLCGIKPLFDKEGKGRFSDETDMANNSPNFWDRTLALASVIPPTYTTRDRPIEFTNLSAIEHAQARKAENSAK